MGPAPDRAPGRASAEWHAAAAVGIIAAVLAGAVAWMSMGGSGLAKDFSLPWTAARHLLEGRDPYAAMSPTGVYPFNVPFYYPLPAAVIAVPFALLPATVAGITFVALSFGIAGFLLARDNPARAIGLLGFPAVMAAALGQWSPLLLAATVAPLLQFTMPVKPTLGAAVFVNRPSWVGLAAAAVVLALSFLIMPHWVASWRSAVASAWDMYTPPVRWAGGAGLVLLASLALWRDPDARLLAVLALAPQLPLFYDQLLAHGVARTKREAWILVAVGWIGGLAWAFRGAGADGAERPARGIILTTVYLPALFILALRYWTQRQGSASSARNSFGNSGHTES
ncbi:MAG: hypothetical protein K0S86_4656 [Geminicoccaceae bacterium]|nr:hypothetical protein [Geminicoccaceae bacterium]